MEKLFHCHYSRLLCYYMCEKCTYLILKNIDFFALIFQFCVLKKNYWKKQYVFAESKLEKV